MKTLVHFAPELFMEEVHPTTIAVIGCGGTGSHILAQLARVHTSLLGLGKPGLQVVAWDDDHVSESNLGRQCFSPADIGQNKAMVLISRINRFHGLNWEAIPERFNSLTYSNMCNITISCVDSAKGRIEIGKVFKHIEKHQGFTSKSTHPVNQPFYWLDIGNSQKTGQIILGTNFKIKQPKGNKYKKIDKLPNILDVHPDISEHDNEVEQGPSCSMAQALNKQDLFINSILAEYASHILWNLLKDKYITFTGMYLNLQTMRTAPIPLSA